MRNINEFWDHFDALVSSKGYTIASLCRTTGISNATISMSKKRQGYPNLETMAKLADGLACTIDYLLYDDRGEDNVHHPKEGVMRIPHLSQKLSAGKGVEWEQDVEQSTVTILDSLSAGQPTASLVSAIVKGDSMKDESLYDGDLVIFSRGYVSGNGIYAIAIDGEVYVKRLAWNPIDKKVTIISANQAYAPVTVNANDDRLIILGKVTGWLHANRN